MGIKKDNEQRTTYQCDNEDCRKKVFIAEAIEKWAEFEGKTYCFPCSLERSDFKWRFHFITNLVSEHKRREDNDKKG